ncbi:hypothetical protein HNQ36_003307 [Afipia massiliensis]|uniref:Uncharacterized protein n=1 Tax=Afipia massiliensis TaxID=211460 RepID=A0A840N9D7_9BRAD|nr:hypothetical protein [Afipia massiliensis]MBB5053316.1 hypothetical protein [Afipia massiliensis]
MPTKSSKKAVAKADLDIKRLDEVTRAAIIDALESLSRPLTLTDEDRLAAARMLRGENERRVRISKNQAAHFAAFYWRKLKRYAATHGRERLGPELRELAATESIRLAAMAYPTQSSKLKAKDVLKLIDAPTRKSVKRKGDDVARVELRNTKLLAHFKSIDRLTGFGFNFYVRPEVRMRLKAKPSK